MGLLQKLSGFLVALLLVPMLAGYGLAFAGTLKSLDAVTSAQVSFVLGWAIYLAIHTIVWKPSRLYVFGHELLHAVAIWVSGGWVHSFKVSKEEGSVTGTRGNLLVYLAPYLVPFYTVLAVLVFFVLGWFYDLVLLSHWFYGALGGSLAFHLSFTAETLKHKQSDIEKSGVFLSFVLIVWTNLIFVVWAFSLVNPAVRVWPYLAEGFNRGGAMYTAVFRQLFSV